MSNNIRIAGGDTAQPLNLQKRLAIIQGRVNLTGLKLLDCGCGEGDYVVAFRALGANAVGIEFLSEKIERARSVGREKDIVDFGDAQELKFEDKSFDAVVFNEVLEHVPDDFRALAEARRVLKPEGDLFVFSPNRLYPFETHGVYKKGTQNLLPVWTPFIPYLPKSFGRRYFDYWARNYWPRELSELVQGAGFEIVQKKFVWQTFEGIANDGSGTTNWMRPLRPALRRLVATMEGCVGIRRFGVSQFIHATRASD